jgi:SAM-dependent methyltransferase
LYKERWLTHNWLLFRSVNVQLRRRLPAFSGIVLDLGCGTRPFETDILQYATTYIGIDWSNSLHELHADIIANLNTLLPIADGTVDHVTAFEVLEHLSEPLAMLKEGCRVLRPNGKLTISVPFQRWIHEAPWDYYRYTCYGLYHLLESAGFSDIVVIPTTGFWSMWILKLNYQLARLIRGPRVMRMVLRAMLIPLWWGGQCAALILDCAWKEERETAGYFVTAQKA